MPTRIINKPKLLDEIIQFNTYACLFDNIFDENEENPTLTEPSFDGYSTILLEGSKWGPAIQEDEYATTTYSEEVFWVNNSGSTITIYGHFVKNSDNKTLWFNKFENPVDLGTGEGIYMYPKIYLDKTSDMFNTFFIFKIINPSPSPIELNPAITIVDEFWGNIEYPNSLINAVTGDNTYTITNLSLNLALNSQIKQTEDLPFSFKIILQQSGFFTTEKSISVIEPGVYDIDLYMIELG